MAYFSNGTEGEIWKEENCNGCIHDDFDNTCPVIGLHHNWNYEQQKCDDVSKIKKFALDYLIPQDGVFAGKCRMFFKKL